MAKSVYQTQWYLYMILLRYFWPKISQMYPYLNPGFAKFGYEALVQTYNISLVLIAQFCENSDDCLTDFDLINYVSTRTSKLIFHQDLILAFSQAQAHKTWFCEMQDGTLVKVVKVKIVKSGQTIMVVWDFVGIEIPFEKFPFIARDMY